MMYCYAKGDWVVRVGDQNGAGRVAQVNILSFVNDVNWLTFYISTIVLIVIVNIIFFYI